jgi:hypothetical protein
MPKKKPAQFQPATEGSEGGALCRSRTVAGDAPSPRCQPSIIDVMPYVPFQVRAAYLAISGSLSTLERHLEELNPESKL